MTDPHASPTTIFFDLDGTLTDPKPGITGCIQYALDRLGEPVPDADALEWCIGPPLIGSFRELVGDARAEQAVALYRERFADVGLFENALYPDIPELLTRLDAQGKRLFVASSKPLVYVSRILDHFDLSRFFVEAFGSELDGRLSDKSELLAHALDTRQITADVASMVGDRSHDIVGALNNGLHATGVLYGYGSHSELANAGAHAIAERPQDLASLYL